MKQGKRQANAPAYTTDSAANDRTDAIDSSLSRHKQGTADLVDSALSILHMHLRARDTQGKDFHLEPTEENKHFLGGFLLNLRPKSSFLEMSRKWK